MTVANIRKARADKENDARLWTAQDALEDVLQDLKAGKAKIDQLALHWLEELPEGGYRHHYCIAGCTSPQHIALLELGKNRAISDWMA